MKNITVLGMYETTTLKGVGGKNADLGTLEVIRVCETNGKRHCTRALCCG